MQAQDYSLDSVLIRVKGKVQYSDNSYEFFPRLYVSAMYDEFEIIGDVNGTFEFSYKVSFDDLENDGEVSVYIVKAESEWFEAEIVPEFIPEGQELIIKTKKKIRIIGWD